jgi:pimeloyl-ACP methyl ester carboxylesterase
MTNAKPVLIFVPGLGATGETYEPFLRTLRSEYDVRVGMYRGQAPERPDFDFFYDGIEHAAAGADSFLLVGHSKGGTIVLAYAADRPDRVERVVAVAPPVVTKRTLFPRGLVRFRWYRRLQNLWLGLVSLNLGHALRTIRIRSEVLAGTQRRVLYDWINSVDLRNRLDRLPDNRVLWERHEEVLTEDHLEELRRHPTVRLKLIAGSHNQLPINPRPILGDLREAING